MPPAAGPAPGTGIDCTEVTVDYADDPALTPEERLAAWLARAEVTLETRGEESLRLALPAHCSSADSLFAVSREAGFHIEGLTPLRASLEQVFLEAVATAERAQEAPLS